MIIKVEKLKNNLLIKYRNISLPVKASMWFLVMGVLQKGISFISTPIFTRLMDTSEYGEYNVFQSWLNIIMIFATLNLFSGVFMRGLIKFKDDREVFTSSIQGLTTTLVVITFISYVVFKDFWFSFFNIPFNLMLAMFLDILMVASFKIWASKKRVDYKYKNLVKLTLFNALAITIVGIILVILSQNKAEARIYSLVLVNLTTFGFIYIKQAKTGKVFYHKKYWKYALMFNLPLLPHYLSQIVLNQSDRLMINYLIGPSEAGIYSVAYSISMVLLIVNTSILNTLNPWIYKKIEESKFKDIANTSYVILVVIAVLNLTLIALAPEAISIMAPPQYHSAIWVIPPVTSSVFFIFMYSLFADFEFYFEKTKLIMIASIFGAILNILLNYLLIPKFGFIAAGYTTLICYIIYVLVHYLFMKLINKRFMNNTKVYEGKIILGISISFLVLAASFTLLYNYLFLRYILILVIVAGALYKRMKIINTFKKIKNM